MIQPNCIECGETYDPRRSALGYRTCLDCGSPRVNFPVIPMTKSNYVCGSLADLKESYGAKGPRA